MTVLNSSLEEDNFLATSVAGQEKKLKSIYNFVSVFIYFTVVVWSFQFVF